MTVAGAKLIKNGEINTRTGGLIETGSHEFPADSGDLYSTSKHAQNNMLADRVDYNDDVLTDSSDDLIYSLKDDTTKPLKCSDIKAFYASMKKSIIDQKTAGQVLRDSVNACTTIQAVSDVDDTR